MHVGIGRLVTLAGSNTQRQVPCTYAKLKGKGISTFMAIGAIAERHQSVVLFHGA